MQRFPLQQWLYDWMFAQMRVKKKNKKKALIFMDVLYIQPNHTKR